MDGSSSADIELIINPNGPLLNGGSDGDNGQTGRKLVMDYYGPARAHRRRRAVRQGFEPHRSRRGLRREARGPACRARRARANAGSWWRTRQIATCRSTWSYEMDERAERLPLAWFTHSAVRHRYRGGAFVAGLGTRGHFGDSALPWNDSTKRRVARFSNDRGGRRANRTLSDAPV